MDVIPVDNNIFNKTTRDIILQLRERYPELSRCALPEAIATVSQCFMRGNKLLVCGNGGSAADAMHIVGELMKGFLLPRKLDIVKIREIEAMLPEDTATYLIDNLQRGLPAISLVSEASLITAYSNDVAADLVFAQQVLGYGLPGDILLAISTSGNSKNVIHAAQVAKVQGMTVVGLTGRSGGLLKEFADVLICAPSDDTYIIQEYHLSLYHALCAGVESEIFHSGQTC